MSSRRNSRQTGVPIYRGFNTKGGPYKKTGNREVICPACSAGIGVYCTRVDGQPTTNPWLVHPSRVRMATRLDNERRGL